MKDYKKGGGKLPSAFLGETRRDLENCLRRKVKEEGKKFAMLIFWLGFISSHRTYLMTNEVLLVA